jgi:alpha-beta hydrolase superfamily lysophospholipase
MMRAFDGWIGRRAAAALSLVLAAVLQGCAAPVEYWHSQRLTEEFTSADAQRIASFEDYLALEERLFAQLDSKVHAAAGSGSSVSMLRYGKGGAADPRRQSPNWNRSFELRADAPVGGVLLLHGMSDSPYSLRAIGQALHRRGYHVVGLRLPGHGTAPSGLTTVRWEDMAGATRLAMGHLASRLGDRPIHVIGYSTGATLALDFALDALDGRVAPVPGSLVLISPAVGLHAAAGLAVWKRRLSMLPGLGGLAWLVIEPEFDPYKYNSFATNAGEQVHRLTRSVGRRLERRARSGPATMFPPTLVLKSNADATVSHGRGGRSPAGAAGSRSP